MLSRGWGKWRRNPESKYIVTKRDKGFVPNSVKYFCGPSRVVTELNIANLQELGILADLVEGGSVPCKCETVLQET